MKLPVATDGDGVVHAILEMASFHTARQRSLPVLAVLEWRLLREEKIGKFFGRHHAMMLFGFLGR